MPENVQEIIKRIKEGDQAAFRELVEAYRQSAFSLAFRIVCDEEEARDVVQESFIKIWIKIGTYDISQKFQTWMYRIITNSAIDKVRQMKRRRLVSIEKVQDRIENKDAGSFGNEDDNADIARLIRHLADGLPEKQQLVFILRDIEGVESDEVGKILDLSADSVKSNLYHARKTIREKLVRANLYEGRQ